MGRVTLSKKGTRKFNCNSNLIEYRGLFPQSLDMVSKNFWTINNRAVKNSTNNCVKSNQQKNVSEPQQQLELINKPSFDNILEYIVSTKSFQKKVVQIIIK